MRIVWLRITRLTICAIMLSGIICTLQFEKKNHRPIFEEGILAKVYSNTSSTSNICNESNTSDKTSTSNNLSEHPRLRRFTVDNMNGFPKPEFHGCNKQRFCSFKNVCFSKLDGMLIFLTPEFLQEEKEWHTETKKAGLDRVTLPRRPILWSNYTELTNVHFAERMFVLSCWRQAPRAINPAHMLMGTGKLFTAATGYYETGTTKNGSNLSLDVVLHHHCTNPSEINWAWGELIESLVSKEVLSAGILAFPSKTLNSTSIHMSYAHGATLKKDDLVICGKTVYQEPFSTALYLGPNNALVVAKWQALVGNHVKEQKWTMATKETLNLKGLNSTSSCRRNLRIAVWRRTEGTALRLLTNLDDIERLVAEYSDQPLSILTASSKTSAKEQVVMFRSFDILITPHGSHLANMIFSPPNATVYIEVASMNVGAHFEKNALVFAKDYITSFGHLPVSNDSEVLGSMELCMTTNKEVPSGCSKSLAQKLKQSDMLVNTTILRADLEKAVSALCPKE